MSASRWVLAGVLLAAGTTGCWCRAHKPAPSPSPIRITEIAAGSSRNIGFRPFRQHALPADTNGFKRALNVAREGIVIGVMGAKEL